MAMYAAWTICKAKKVIKIGKIMVGELVIMFAQRNPARRARQMTGVIEKIPSIPTAIALFLVRIFNSR
jgi:hypothetical protein